MCLRYARPTATRRRSQPFLSISCPRRFRQLTASNHPSASFDSDSLTFASLDSDFDLELQGEVSMNLRIVFPAVLCAATSLLGQEADLSPANYLMNFSSGTSM